MQANLSNIIQSNVNATDAGPRYSGNGRYVAFLSKATNLSGTDSNGHDDMYVKDLQTGAIGNAAITFDGVQADADSKEIALSYDGRLAAFTSYASNLVADDVSYADIFIKDMVTGGLLRATTGLGGQAANGNSDHGVFSADGRYLVFASQASNLVAGDSNGTRDVFRKDLSTGVITRVSLTADGVQAAGDAGDASVSADGRYIVFSSTGNFTPGDGDGGVDTAVYQGARANYAIATSASGTVITDNSGVDGVDTVANVERLHFANADVALDVNGSAGMAYRLYQAAFDRTPDLVGLGFWLKQLDGGVSRLDVANAFLTVPEGQALYGVNTDTGTLVTAMYNHVLHRAPDAGGYAFWVNGLESHRTTAAEVLTYFAESVENQAALIGTIQNGMTYVPYV